MADFRPPTSSGRRPGSRAGGTARQPTAMSRAPPTAIRLGTGAPGTARPGTRGGAAGGSVLGSQVRVVDRPMTQQGLGGMKTGSKGPQRQVQDRSFWLGQLRSKIQELQAEVTRLTREKETLEQENSSYLSYEKRAETLASELRGLQGELADYNMLVDKINTDTEMEEVMEDYNMLKVQNDREEKNMDTIFTERRQKEEQLRQLEQEIEQQRRLTDSLVEGMSPDKKGLYNQLKKANLALLEDLERQQQELDSLNMKRENLEDELSTSTIKQEAVRLYEQLHELQEKRDNLMAEDQAKGSPAEEREKLLKQVKEDNQEIASMDRQTGEIREKINVLQEEIRQLDMDLEEHQGERNLKYKELKKREETMDEFLNSFEQTKGSELETKGQLEGNIVALLEASSRKITRARHLPGVTQQQLRTLQDDLNFKETEMEKSKATAANLAEESQKLQMDLAKVEQLETKITTELESLKQKIQQMHEELSTYEDLDKLKEHHEEKKRKLQEDKVLLMKRRDMFKTGMSELSAQYDLLKAQLNDNETHTQLSNLQRKWQHHEQNNFVMKEFIATKTMESDFRPTMSKVTKTVEDYNKMLQDQLSGRPVA
ncbi:intraflagellar transport protein 74 homolog isoform X1 [Branchiostoma lanceolatum]|uniref:IFT74 protein n=3 Tax=Branchiostoma lanceolatum TaxID=7740 RepID=A0A8J9YXN1_BRALA|nr:IFT74 [Branchiostoma lanceolatum]